MQVIELNVNGVPRQVEAAPETPLLWVLRDHLNLTGTKFGCGVMQCGACTVHVDGVAQRTCVFPVSNFIGKKIRTIEDLGAHGLSALQQAWIRHQVPQCGYCQSGMLMAASSLLAQNPSPTDADIDAGIDNICRCGTYQRIRAAIKDAAQVLTADSREAVNLAPAADSREAVNLAPAADSKEAVNLAPAAGSKEAAKPTPASGGDAAKPAGAK